MTEPEVRSLPRVRLERWFARGRCLARDLDTGDTFLCEGGVPGELVSARLYTWEHHRLAVVDAVHEPSPQRVEPFCPHARTCTGCGLLHVSEAEELRYKALTLSEVLERFAGIAIEPDEINVFPDARRGDHRARARFSVDRGPAGIKLGLRDTLGGIVHVPDCPASTPAVRQMMERIAGISELMSATETLEVRQQPSGEVHSRLSVAPEVDIDALMEVCHAHGLERMQVMAGDDGARPTHAPWSSPNPRASKHLYKWVDNRAGCDGRNVLDGTCGTGGMSLLLARRAAAVVGVDVHYDAILRARERAEAQGVSNVAFRGGKLGTVAPRMVDAGEMFDVALINPMRSPLGERAMRAMRALGVERLLYLAPSPMSGAKDIAVLLDEGFAINEVAGCNLHPGTGAIMLCAVLVREPD